MPGVLSPPLGRGQGCSGPQSPHSTPLDSGSAFAERREVDRAFSCHVGWFSEWGGVSLFEQRVLFRVCEGTGQMSSVCMAQKDRVSGELARSILLFPDCRTHCSDGTVSNTEVTVLPPKSHRCEPMGFCQPVLQASFHHLLQVSRSRPGQPHPAAVVGPWRVGAAPGGTEGPSRLGIAASCCSFLSFLWVFISTLCQLQPALIYCLNLIKTLS